MMNKYLKNQKFKKLKKIKKIDIIFLKKSNSLDVSPTKIWIFKNKKKKIRLRKKKEIHASLRWGFGEQKNWK